MASIRGLIALLATTTLSSPLAEISALEPRQQFTLPSRTLANGANNPFFPCGLDPSTCPYRCYDLPPASTNSTQNNLSVLQSRCFTQAQAADYVDLSKHPASEGHACVKCVKPLAVEVPKSKSAPVNCQPLETYFRATAGYGDNALREFGFARPFPGAALPSRCGSRADPIPECAWECAAAQVCPLFPVPILISKQALMMRPIACSPNMC